MRVFYIYKIIPLLFLYTLDTKTTHTFFAKLNYKNPLALATQLIYSKQRVRSLWLHNWFNRHSELYRFHCRVEVVILPLVFTVDKTKYLPEIVDILSDNFSYSRGDILIYVCKMLVKVCNEQDTSCVI